MPTPRQIEEAIEDAEKLVEGEPSAEPSLLTEAPSAETTGGEPEIVAEGKLEIVEPPPVEEGKVEVIEEVGNQQVEVEEGAAVETVDESVPVEPVEPMPTDAISSTNEDMENTALFAMTNIDPPEPEPEPPTVDEMDLKPIMESIVLGSGLITSTSGLKVGLNLSDKDIPLTNKILPTNETTAESIRRNLNNLSISEIEEYRTNAASSLEPSATKWVENAKLWKSFQNSLNAIDDIDLDKFDALIAEKEKSKDQPSEEAIAILEQLGEKGEAVCACLWAPFPKPTVNSVMPLKAADGLWKGVIGEQINAIKETSEAVPSSLAASLVANENSDGKEMKDALNGIIEASTLCTAPHQGFLLYPTGDGYVNQRTSTFVGNRKEVFTKRQEQTTILNKASAEILHDNIDRNTGRAEAAVLNATSGLPLFAEDDSYSNDYTFRGNNDAVTAQFEDRIDVLKKASLETRKELADRKGGAHKATIHGTRYGDDIAALSRQEIVALYPSPPPPPPAPPKKLGNCKDGNGAIVKLHLGQRGCTLGARVVLEQASFHESTGIADPTFWLQGKEGDECGHRSVFIDSESDTSAYLFGPRSVAKTLFDTSQFVSVDGFHQGSFILDKKKKISEAVQNSIRIQLELCDRLQGFVVTRSLADAGGTLGSMLFNDGGFLQEECPKASCLSFDIVDGIHALPSTGIVGTMNEAFALSDIGLMKNDRFLSAIIANEALYKHPGRRTDQDDPENCLAAKAIAGLLATCSDATAIGKSQSMDELLATTTASRPGCKLAAISYLPRRDTKIWSAKLAWGQGLLSPWDLKEVETKGANFGNFTSLGTSYGTPKPEFPRSNATYSVNVGADFVAALGCNAVTKKCRYSTWLRGCQKRARNVGNKRAFSHHYPTNDSERYNLEGFDKLLAITASDDSSDVVGNLDEVPPKSPPGGAAEEQ